MLDFAGSDAIISDGWARAAGDKIPWELVPATQWNPNTGEAQAWDPLAGSKGRPAATSTSTSASSSATSSVLLSVAASCSSPNKTKSHLLPGGSWLQSARNVQLEGGRLHAELRSASGVWCPASIALEGGESAPEVNKFCNIAESARWVSICRSVDLSM